MSVHGYTYSGTQRVQLTLNQGSRVNAPMIKDRITVYSGISNKIEFQLRNNDRKPEKLFNHSIRVHISDPATGYLMTSKTAVIENDILGLYSITLSPSDLAGWKLGLYDFSTIYIDSDGNEFILYTDQSRTTKGTFELFARPYPIAVSPFVVKWTDVLLFDGFYISEKSRGSFELGVPGIEQIVNLNTTTWTGDFIIQGSLDGNPGQSDADGWINVQDVDIAGSVNTDYTIATPYRWIRFKFLPSESNTGTINSVTLTNE